MTSDGGGGMVSSRDFVYAAKTGYKGDVFVMGGRSVDYKDAPSSSKIVRCESLHQMEPVCKLWMTLLILCLLIVQGDQWTGMSDDLACCGRRQLLHVHLADGLRLQGLDASG